MYVLYKNELLEGKKRKNIFSIISVISCFKTCIKRVKNIDLLHELPFYDDLSIVEISQALKRYTRNYK